MIHYCELIQNKGKVTGVIWTCICIWRDHKCI